LRHAQKLAGIIALSTYLPMAGLLAAERSAANADMPIFWGHGTSDPVVALQRGVESRAALEALGYPVAWHTYPMPHAVCPDEIADLRRWIGERVR
jgi:phospholipase/carboxylesterase